MKSDKPHYINVGRYEQSIQQFNYENTELIPQARVTLEESTRYNLIYVNPDNTLYLRERVE